MHIVNCREKDVEIEAAHEETPKRDESIDKPEMERSDSKPMEDAMVGCTHRQTDNP